LFLRPCSSFIAPSSAGFASLPCLPPGPPVPLALLRQGTRPSMSASRNAELPNLFPPTFLWALSRRAASLLLVCTCLMEALSVLFEEEWVLGLGKDESRV
jgi:hypothetical protein